MSANDALLAAAANGVKTALDAGFIYYFAGPVPADENEALDMVNDHTQVAKLTVDDDGTTGLTFTTATTGVLSKTGSEDWIGTVAFDGAEDGESTLSPTFYRHGVAADDCRGAGSTARMQGTLGGPSSSADIKLASDTVTANGTNTVSLPIYSVNVSALG